MDIDKKLFISRKYEPGVITGTTAMSMQLLSMPVNRLKTMQGLLGWCGNYFEKYKERVLNALYTNNKRKRKGIPIRRKIALKQWRMYERRKNYSSRCGEILL